MKRVLFFLGQLDDRDIEWMAYDGHKLKLDAGAMLIQKGKNVDNLYIVLNGQLKVLSDTKNKTIATLRSGEILGEMSFLESRPPSVSVKATEPLSNKDIKSRIETLCEVDLLDIASKNGPEHLLKRYYNIISNLSCSQNHS